MYLLGRGGTIHPNANDYFHNSKRNKYAHTSSFFSGHTVGGGGTILCDHIDIGKKCDGQPFCFCFVIWCMYDEIQSVRDSSTLNSNNETG